MSNNLPEAFSFASPLDFNGIWEKLKDTTLWNWTANDSDNYGDYLLGRPDELDCPVWLRLYKEKSGYLIEFDYHYSKLAKGQTADHLVTFVKDLILPAIGATNIKEAKSIR